MSDRNKVGVIATPINNRGLIKKRRRKNPIDKSMRNTKVGVFALKATIGKKGNQEQSNKTKPKKIILI